jgi:hypothetical protein
MRKVKNRKVESFAPDNTVRRKPTASNNTIGKLLKIAGKVQFKNSFRGQSPWEIIMQLIMELNT